MYFILYVPTSPPRCQKSLFGENPRDEDRGSTLRIDVLDPINGFVIGSIGTRSEGLFLPVFTIKKGRKVSRNDFTLNVRYFKCRKFSY